MPGLIEIGLGILLPALLCGILLAVGQWGRWGREEREGQPGELGQGARSGSWRSARTDDARGALAGLAFGLPWMLSFAAFFRRLPAWPTEGTTPSASDWLGWIVLLAALTSLLYLAPIPARQLSNVLRVLFSAGLVLLTLARWAERTSSWTTVAVSILVIAAVWNTADVWIGRGNGPRAPLVLVLAATSASLANLFARSAILGALAGAVAACLGAAFVLSLFRPGFRLHPAASAVVVLVLAGTLLQGCVFSKLPIASALLVAASLLAPGLADLGRPAAENSWKRTWIASALALVPGILAVWTAWSPSDDLYGSF